MASVAGDNIISTLGKYNFHQSSWSVNNVNPSSIHLLQVPSEIPAVDYLTQYTDYISNANDYVDIANFEVGVNNVDMDSIAKALETLSYQKPNKRIIVRLMVGNFTFFSYFTALNPEQIIARITKNLNPNSKMEVYVGMYRTDINSWNHAKILAVDGKDLITGGIGFINSDYTDDFNPVNDVSVGISNNAGIAKAASSFLDQEWKYLCNYKNSWVHNSIGSKLQYLSWSSGHTNKNNCAPFLQDNYNPRPAGLLYKRSLNDDYIISVGRWAGLDNGSNNASDIALITMLEQAHSNILLSQQTLKLNYVSLLYDFPKKVVKTLCQKMENGVAVKLLISGSNGHPGFDFNQAPHYGASYTPTTMAEFLALTCGRDYTRAQHGALLQIKVYPNKIIAPFIPAERVPNHAKLVMIDSIDGGNLVYVGSHNLYDASHSEYGVIIDSIAFAKVFKQEYWNNSWGK